MIAGSIEIVAVGAHDDCRRHAAIGEPVDAADEGIDPADLLMLHLGRFSRLRERVGLVDEKDHRAPGPFAVLLDRGGFLDREVEGGGDQLGDLADAPLAARRQAKRQQLDLDALLACDRIGDGLGELGLSGADVAAEDDERRPPLSTESMSRPALG